MEPLVSVIIPTFNRVDNLRRSIDSALNQTYSNIEVIVVDDNDPLSKARVSTESLMIQYLNNNNVHYEKHIKNKNGAAARNTGIMKSSGEYIAFLDDDDEWVSNKIEKQISYLCMEVSYGGCYCLSNKYFENQKYYSTIYQSVGCLLFDLLALNSEIYTPSLVFRKSILVEIGGFDESFVRHQDFELLAKFFIDNKLGCVPEHLVNVYVDDPQNHPPYEVFKRNKLYFLDKFKNQILELTCEQQKAIYQSHYFEIFYYALKCKCYKNAILYLIKSKPNFYFFSRNKAKIISVLKRRFLFR